MKKGKSANRKQTLHYMNNISSYSELRKTDTHTRMHARMLILCQPIKTFVSSGLSENFCVKNNIYCPASAPVHCLLCPGKARFTILLTVVRFWSKHLQDQL